MQLFLPYPCPTLSAAALDDRRMNKAIIETAQFLSTACHITGIVPPALPGEVYKKTHPRHPVTLWAAHSRHNAFFALTHLFALLDTYSIRFNKRHKTTDIALTLAMLIDKLPDVPATPPVNCTPFKDNPDTYAAYRLTLIDKWHADTQNGYPPRWTNASPPEWYRPAALASTARPPDSHDAVKTDAEKIVTTK